MARVAATSSLAIVMSPMTRPTVIEAVWSRSRVREAGSATVSVGGAFAATTVGAAAAALGRAASVAVVTGSPPAGVGGSASDGSSELAGTSGDGDGAGGVACDGAS